MSTMREPSVCQTCSNYSLWLLKIKVPGMSDSISWTSHGRSVLSPQYVLHDRGPSLRSWYRSASQEITRLLRNPKLHYRFHKSPLLYPNLNQANPVHILAEYFSKIHQNLGLPSSFLLLRFLIKISYVFLISSKTHTICYYSCSYFNNRRQKKKGMAKSREDDACDVLQLLFQG